MTKSELMARLAEVFEEKNADSELQTKDIEYSVKVLVDTMTRALAKGQRIEIRGFGSFDLNERPARKGRNPKTGESVDVPKKYVPHFKPGKELRERVDIHA
jgi:integration host factor, beta subunit